MRRGLSLAEVMVSLAIMSVLMVGMVQLYGTSYQAYSLGTNRLRLQQKARVLMQRISMDLRAAIAPSVSGQAVEIPILNTNGPEVVFNRAVGTFDTFDPRSATFQRWHLLYDAASGKVKEEKWDPATTSWVYNTTLGASITNDNTFEAYSLYSVDFSRPEASAVHVNIQLRGTVQNASGRQNVESYVLESDVPIPYFTLSH